MNQRVRYVRKALKLTQTEFGQRLGVTDGAITLIENGKRNLTEQMKISICREFAVNPKWLETGEGEPFRTEESDLDKVIDLLMVDEKETAKAVFKALAKMGGNEWAVFRRAILSVAHEIEQSEQKKE